MHGRLDAPRLQKLAGQSGHLVPAVRSVAERWRPLVINYPPGGGLSFIGAKRGGDQ